MTTQPTGLTGGPGSHVPTPFGTTRTATRVRGRAVLAALGLALATAVLPSSAVHASPQPPGIGHQLADPGGNPQPPEPPDPPQWGPQDLADPTDDPEPPLPPQPPDNGPDDEADPADNPEPPPPPNQDPTPPAGDSIPIPQRVDAGFGGAAPGSHHAAGLALLGAALVLTLLVIAIAHRHSDTGSTR